MTKSNNILNPNHQSITYQSAIDGLRAIAILLVLGFHAFPSLIPGGYIGVDVFFVISGYLITSIILSDLSKKSFSIKEFYYRRVRRILPSLLFIFVLAYAVGWFVFTPIEFEKLNKQIAAGSFFASNFVFWKQSGYFDVAAELKPFQHLWSLAIEEQFYLLWPLALLLLSRWRKGIWWFIVAIICLSLVANLVISGKDTVHAFYSPWTRFWELAIGGYIAYLGINRPKQNIEKIPSLLSSGLVLLGLVLIVYGAFALDSASVFPGYWALLPTLGAACIIAAPQSPIRALLGSRLLVSIGLISYPLYLWHWVLLSFARTLYGQSLPLALRALMVICSFGLAWLTYRYIERPFRFGARPQFKAKLLIGLLVVVGAVAFITKEKDGLPQRFSVPNLVNHFQVAHCEEDFGDDTFKPCVFGNLKSEKNILIYGDSMAGQLTGAMNELYGKDYKITFLYYKNCFDSTVDGVDKDRRCQNIWNVIKELRKINLDLIIHSQWWHINSRESFDSQMEHVANMSGLKANKYIIASGVAWIDLNCYEAAYYFSFRGKNCLRDEESIRSNRLFSEYSRQIKLKNGIQFIYPYEEMCPNDQCRVIEGSTLNFHDERHLSKDGALQVMPQVKKIFE